MVWRRRVMRTRSSRAASLGGDGRAHLRHRHRRRGHRREARRRRPARQPRAAAAGLAAAATASSLRICPRLPEPCTSASASPFSSMILRAAGDGRHAAVAGGRSAAGAGGASAACGVGAAVRLDAGLPRGAGAFLDRSQHRADADGRALLHLDVGENAGRRCRHLHRHLVGLELDQRLIGLDGVARLLEPLADRRLGHGFAQRRHFDLDGHRHFSPPQPASACSTSAFCSWLCLLACPVAVAADGGRPT